MADLPFDVADPRLAAAAWTRLAEPGVLAGGLLRTAMGTSGALDWVCQLARRGAGAPVPRPPWLRPEQAAEVRWEESVARWLPRVAGLDIRRELDVLASLGGRLVVPDDDEWPRVLDDLGPAAPAALWVRGHGSLRGLGRAAAVVGARASTGYGEHVAAELAIGLGERGVVVVSGGAYGIDAAAHRGALSTGAATCAVLAGGVDRLYPAGNTALLERILDDGVVLAEAPPGSAPTRWRFLDRNRLIAALGQVCVIVEAAWRSGALNTASHAFTLLRPVGVVPGPVTSMASVGCHRLLRESDAVCVTDTADVLELLGPAGENLPTEPAVQPGLLDGLDPVAARLLDAMPARAATSPQNLARSGGLGAGEVRSALGRLELAGAIQRHGGGWRRARKEG